LLPLDQGSGSALLIEDVVLIDELGFDCALIRDIALLEDVLIDFEIGVTAVSGIGALSVQISKTSQN